MSDNAPEPGFVQAYRLFVVIRIIFWVAVGPVLALIALAEAPALTAAEAAGTDLVQHFSLYAVAPMLAVDVLLLALLVWPAATRWLGNFFVPVTLGLGLVPLLVGYYRWPAENPLQSPFIMFFFVTAVLIAWEYKHRWVLLYVVLLSVFEALVSPWPVRMPWSVPVGWLVLQAVMMLLAGYVTATLARVQSNQRVALSEAYQRQAEANRRLQEHAAVLEELVTTRERNRLARELHDTLAHSLSAVTVQIEAVSSLWDTEPEKAQHILEQAGETARTGLGEARRALRALRASPLEELGLSLAIAELAESSARRAGAELTCDLPERWTENPSLAVEQGVYRIAQETLENIVNHAGARHISVRLEECGNDLELTIEDDGQGMEDEAVAGEGFGIRGMQERAPNRRATED